MLKSGFKLIIKFVLAFIKTHYYTMQGTLSNAYHNVCTSVVNVSKLTPAYRQITCNPDHIHWISIEQMLERQSTIQGQTHTHTHDR